MPMTAKAASGFKPISMAPTPTTFSAFMAIIRRPLGPASASGPTAGASAT
jgi:hypothetical protein